MKTLNVGDREYIGVHHHYSMFDNLVPVNFSRNWKSIKDPIPRMAPVIDF
jgi:hypothetical protein